jgi:hypothetical protein
LKLQFKLPAGTLALPRRGESIFDKADFQVPKPVALSAAATPVPTASTKQEHNQHNNQNRLYAHIEVL